MFFRVFVNRKYQFELMNRGHIYSWQVKSLTGWVDMNRQTALIKFQNRVNQCVAG